MKRSTNDKRFGVGFRAAILGAAVAGLVACGEKSDGMLSEQDTMGAVAVFDPAAGKIPFPSNLLFAGSTDGTLNIPVADATNFGDPAVAMNALDGFSTNAPWSTTIAGDVNPSSLVLGETVRVFKVTLSGIGGAVTTVQSELGASELAVAVRSQGGQAQLVVAPLKPLAAKTTYMVVLAGRLTQRIADIYGHPVVADKTYAFAKSTSSLVDGAGKSRFSALTDAQAVQLEPLRQLTNAAEIAAAAFTGGPQREYIILTSTFTTQSTADVLVKVKQQASAGAVAFIPAGLDANGVVPALADTYKGTVNLPYYLEKANPLTTRWKSAGGDNLTFITPTPVATATLTVPVLLTVPKSGAKPAGGWPIVVFQHGVTQNRTNLLAVADALAQVGLAAIAIDLPLHGITDTASPLYVSGLERTFDLDLINNTSTASGADGMIDPTGTHFVNLRSLLTSRDNVRQAVADLFALTATIPSMDYDAGGADFDASKIYFMGHSLGAMVGTAFLAHSPEVKAAALVNTGGGIAKVLDGSAVFGPIVAAGLKASGIEKGTASYEQFMVAAQTVLDSGDPLNYYAEAVAGRPFLAIDVANDQTIPNSVTGAPLAGGLPIAQLLGLSRITASTADNSGVKGLIRFASGSHNSLLDPSIVGAVTTEMQTELASFLGSAGSQITVTNSSLLVP